MRRWAAGTAALMLLIVIAALAGCEQRGTALQRKVVSWKTGKWPQ